MFIISKQNRKLRDSSNESDDDLDAGTSSPPPRSTVDDTKNVLPSQIKAVAVSITTTHLRHCMHNIHNS